MIPTGLLQTFKDRLKEYPKDLANAIVRHHWGALQDPENFERAVSRKDIFFYHFALDMALDHFLQALFALNKVYFPSRKRSEQYIQGFQSKPAACTDRLREIIALGSTAETLDRSVRNVAKSGCRPQTSYIFSLTIGIHNLIKSPLVVVGVGYRVWLCTFAWKGHPKQCNQAGKR